MTSHELLLWAHVLLFGLWLGADYGTFLSSRYLLRADASLESRATAASLMVRFDLVPRLALVLMLPLGVALASGRGMLGRLPTWTVAVAWVLALAWLTVVVGVALGAGRRWGTPLRRVDLVVRVGVAAGTLGLGAASLAGAGPLAAGWLAWKVTLFGAVVCSGLAIRHGLRGFGPVLQRLLREGSTPGTEQALRASLTATYPFVGAIWLLVLTAGLLGVAKP